MSSKKKRVYIFKKIHAYWQYVLIIIILSGTSCNKHTGSNHAYFDSILNPIDSAATDSHFQFTGTDKYYLDSAFKKAPWVGTDDLTRKYFYNIFHYRSENKYDSVLLYTDSTIALLQNDNSDEKRNSFYLKSLFMQGDMHFLLKDYTRAVRSYTQAKLALAATLHDSASLYEYYNSMSHVLYAQKKFLQAADMFKVKVMLAPLVWGEKLPSKAYAQTQENLDNTGICFSRIGLYDSAMHYYNLALSYINKNQPLLPNLSPAEFDMHRGVVYSNIADILLLKGDKKGAEQAFIKSIADTKTINDAGFTRDLWLSLAGAYLSSNQPKKAATILFDTTMMPADSAEISTATGRFNKLLSDYYAQTGNHQLANAALQHAYNIKNAIEKNELLANAPDISRELGNREQDAINAALKRSNELANSYLLATVIGVCMAGLIGILLYLTLRRKLSFVKTLTSLHNTIQTKNNELHAVLISLEDSHREHNRIMRVVAHDLKNPVSGMGSLAGSLIKKETLPARKEALQLIETTCTDSMMLINDLLTNKRNLGDLSKELVDMGRLIEQCTSLFQMKAGEKQQRIRVQVEYPIVMLNRQRMLRVITNIVTNAIKFSPDHSEILIRLEKKAETVLLSVKDNGIGIPTSLKDKIFTLNPGKSRTGTAGEKSYGLGLSISKQIIDEHAGNFWFESTDGEGSEFFVELPYRMTN